jgi:hypothetical protein
MPALKDDVKFALVQALACYDTPTQAAQMVKEEFGVEISRQQAQYYDPTKVHGHRLGKKLSDLFYVTREKFLEESAKIPIAQQAFRLRALERALRKVEQQGNTAMVAQILEQAAKEVGGVFTNKREITGKGGAPLAALTTNVTPEQLAEAVRSVRQEF